MTTPSVVTRSTADEVAEAGGSWLAASLRWTIGTRGIATLAVSGGSTPGRMFAALAGESLDWAKLHVFQVDERFAPLGHPDRNLTALQATLLDHVGIPPANMHPMPVEAADPEEGARSYAARLHDICGGVLDVVHLGLGDDGHTASLVPGDPALDVVDRNVAVTGEYKGRRRMTLTYPALSRCRSVLWLVAGADKALMVTRLLAEDDAIPAGRVRAENSVLFADDTAAALVAA